MTRRRSFFLFCLIGVVVLSSLGVWQLRRLAWKTELISALEAGALAPPLSFEQARRSAEEFRRVELRGSFRSAPVFYWLRRSRQGEPGLQVLMPFVEASSGATVLVNRGWIPFEQRDAESVLAPSSLGQEEVLVGLLRGEVRGGFATPDNEPEKNIYFTLDPVAMLADSEFGGSVVPWMVFAESNPHGEYPVARQWRIDLHNPHLGYALTWLGLAAGLAAVYGAWLWGGGQKRKKERPRRDALR